MFAAKNLLLTPPVSAAVSVAFDSKGGTSGQTSFNGNMTYTHVIGASAKYLLLGLTSALASGSLYTPTSVTCGASSMTQAKTVDLGGNTALQVWGLANPPTGSQTITVVNPGGFSALWVAVESVAYTNAASLGTAVSATGTGTAMSVTGTGSTGQMLFNVLGCNGGGQAVPSGYSQTLRGGFGSSTAEPTIIGDSASTGSVTFSATAPASGSWGGIVVPINHT